MATLQKNLISARALDAFRLIQEAGEIFSPQEVKDSAKFLAEHQMEAESVERFVRKAERVIQDRAPRLAVQRARRAADEWNRQAAQDRIAAEQERFQAQGRTVAAQVLAGMACKVEFKSGYRPAPPRPPFSDETPAPPRQFHAAVLTFPSSFRYEVPLSLEAPDLLDSRLQDLAESEHFETFARAYAALANPRFHYVRSFDGDCNLYGFDTFSPSGVCVLAVAPSFEFVEFVSRSLGREVRRDLPAEPVLRAM